MRKSVLVTFSIFVLGIVCGAALISLRRGPEPQAQAPAPPEKVAAVPVDAGTPAPPDAGGAMAAPAAPATPGSINPEIRVERQADGSWVHIYPAGVYDAPIRLHGQRDLRLRSEGGPAYVRARHPDMAGLLDIRDSSDISIEGFIFEYDSEEHPAGLPGISLVRSERIKLSQVAVIGADTCVLARVSTDIEISDAVFGPCRSTGVEFRGTRLTLERVRIHTVPTALALQGSVVHRTMNSEVRLSQVIALGDAQISAEPSSTIESSLLFIGNGYSTEMLVPFVKPSAPERVKRPDAPTDKQLASWIGAVSKGASVLVDGSLSTVEDPPALPRGQLPPWFLDEGARDALKEAHDEHRTPVPPAPRILGVGKSYPVCGLLRPILKFQEPGGALVEGASSIEVCEEIVDVTDEPDSHTLAVVTGGWAKLDDFWIRASQFNTADIIRTEELIVPSPFYKSRIARLEGRKLVLEGTADHCAGRSCPREDGTRTEPREVKNVVQEFTLPHRLHRDLLKIDSHFDSDCCE